MNFGKKIVILYLSFVFLIGTLVYMSFGHDVELVSKDYYSQELNFQKKIEAIKNEKALEKSITHQILAHSIILWIDSTLLSSDFKGTIHLYRPSNSKMDKELIMNFNQNQQLIDTKQMTPGAYKLQLSCIRHQKNYYKEEVIEIK
ncbi:MAG: FixH family protein [Bacteroidota bacterium]